MPPSRIGNHDRAAARNNVIGLLRGDHDRLLQEFREFERLDSLQARQACQRVVQRIFAELKVLSGVEQQLFYPAVHDSIAGTDLIDQSQIEHARIQRVVGELEGAQPSQADYWSRFRTLGKYVVRHVQDEEGELFPMLSCVPIDGERLYDDMTVRRAALAEDLGVADLPPLRQGRDREPVPVRLEDRNRELALEGAH